MVGVTYEGDKVLVILPGRRRDVLLTCDQAEEFVQALQRCAALAEREPPALVRGETWEVQVQSYDGFVAVRFFPPFVGCTRRVPVPPEAAVRLAERVKFKAQQAKWKMRFEFSGSVGRLDKNPMRRSPWQKRLLN